MIDWIFNHLNPLQFGAIMGTLPYLAIFHREIFKKEAKYETIVAGVIFIILMIPLPENNTSLQVIATRIALVFIAAFIHQILRSRRLASKS